VRAPRIEWNADLPSQLACPACHGDLRLEGARLVCGGCRRAYPIVDGIPVLIAGRAQEPGGLTAPV
jgi:uncharacterized protein YbaR (Trm112 family)